MLSRTLARLDLHWAGLRTGRRMPVRMEGLAVILGDPDRWHRMRGDGLDELAAEARHVQAHSPLPALPSRAVDRVSNVPPR